MNTLFLALPVEMFAL